MLTKEIAIKVINEVFANLEANHFDDIYLSHFNDSWKLFIDGWTVLEASDTIDFANRIDDFNAGIEVYRFGPEKAMYRFIKRKSVE